MTQTLYAHINKRKGKKKELVQRKKIKTVSQTMKKKKRRHFQFMIKAFQYL
jgi:hypothetical protein